MERKITIISRILLGIGMAIFIPSLILAATGVGVFQTVGVLFGGDIRHSDGFILARGGFEGLSYGIAELEALGVLLGLLFIIIGILELSMNRISLRKKQ